MQWLRKLRRDRVADYSGGWDPLSEAERQLQETHLAMAGALTFGLEARNDRLHFVEHCARVASLVDDVAVAMELSTQARQDLQNAARLHEIGMICIPPELLETPVPLNCRDLERIRAQARLGAEMTRATYSARTARLIECQYTDFADLRSVLHDDADLLLLASILRAADVFDTLAHPRPYQRHLGPADRARIFQQGAGTTFHPEIAALLDRMQDHAS